MAKLINNFYNCVNQLSDNSLIELLREDNRNAFKEIYKRYWKPLFMVASRKVREDIAEELVQDIFVNLWTNRTSQTISNLSYYLFASIKYATIAHLKSEITKSTYAEQADNQTFTHNTAEYELMQNELSEAINKSILLLPLRTQEIFRMSRFEYKSNKEIATHFNITEKAIEYHITQVLKLLKSNLKDFYFISLFFIV